MRGFVGGDFFQVGVEGRVEAAGSEVGLREVLETFLVEGVFEVLEGEGVVEDVGVGNRWGGLTDLFQEGPTAFALERDCFRGESRAFGHSRLGNWTGGSNDSERCNDECGLHVAS